MNSKTSSTNQRTLILLSILFLACFLSLAVWRNSLLSVNQSVNLWSANLHLGSGVMQGVFVVSDLFDTVVLFVASLPIAAILFYKKYKTDAFLLVGAMGVDAVVLTALKTLVVSPRPLDGLILEDSYSFPSGHVTSIIVLLGILTFIMWRNSQTLKPKIAMGVVSAVLIIMVAFDRIILNVHWLTDILAAPFLALFIVSTAILVIPPLIGKLQKSGSLSFLFGSKA